MTAPYSPALVEAIARREFQNDYPRRNWNAKSMPEHERGYYRHRAKWVIGDMGGEAALIAFCEAVMAWQDEEAARFGAAVYNLDPVDVKRLYPTPYPVQEKKP